MKKQLLTPLHNSLSIMSILLSEQAISEQPIPELSVPKE